jgi:UDP-N-acetylmuramoyl-tripeptide--D-alanyl-D-alanine ligase
VELTAAELAAAAEGTVASGSAQARASSYTMDSRLTVPGSAFFALRDSRDGHDFVDDAAQRGATIAVVGRDVDADPRLTLVRVADPLTALAGAGSEARRRLDAATVIGITGSAGKTATKDLTAAALEGTCVVHRSHASYNNEAGVPLTLLSAPPGTEAVVVEMGARFAGNIADLAAIARPSVGVVTHVGMAHAGLLGGRDGIARVKGELVEALPADGLCVLNADCDTVDQLAARSAAPVVRVGRAAGADVRVSDVRLDEELRARFVLDSAWGSGTIEVGLRGEHQVENAAMAATVALALGATFERAAAGLQRAEESARRMELLRTRDGVIVINDAYNSSPTSAAAAVRSLAHAPTRGRRVAVLGEMLELGAHAGAEHEALGALAGAEGIDLLVAVGAAGPALVAGARGSGMKVAPVPDAAAASALLAEQVRGGDVVLVKASRAVGLDEVADALLEARSAS